MVPSGFDEENAVLDAPPGMTPDDCEPLSVWRGRNEADQPVVISCWKPTADEWEEMRRTGRVWIIVYGTTMPPIAPAGISPFRPEESS